MCKRKSFFIKTRRSIRKKQNQILGRCVRHAFVKTREVLCLYRAVISVGDQRCTHNIQTYENYGWRTSSNYCCLANDFTNSFRKFEPVSQWDLWGRLILLSNRVWRKERQCSGGFDRTYNIYFIMCWMAWLLYKISSFHIDLTFVFESVVSKYFLSALHSYFSHSWNFSLLF